MSVRATQFWFQLTIIITIDWVSWMSEEVIERVDELVRKNNIKYKGKGCMMKMSKAKKHTSRP